MIWAIVGIIIGIILGLGINFPIPLELTKFSACSYWEFWTRFSAPSVRK